jgi:hypothetical protein
MEEAIKYYDSRNKFIEQFYGTIGYLPGELYEEGSEGAQAWYKHLEAMARAKPSEVGVKIEPTPIFKEETLYQVGEESVVKEEPVIKEDAPMPVVITGRPMRKARLMNWRDGPVKLRY